jgi:hypothetical protein
MPPDKQRLYEITVEATLRVKVWAADAQEAEDLAENYVDPCPDHIVVLSVQSL